jgi:hypothetical protein
MRSWVSLTYLLVGVSSVYACGDNDNPRVKAAASGGDAVGDGGAPVSQGGTKPNVSGGTAQSGDGGFADGGTVNGGTVNGGTVNGGTVNGGTVNGGTVNGGTVNGGTVNGGTANGGTTNGGAAGDGGNSGGDAGQGGEPPVQVTSLKIDFAGLPDGAVPRATVRGPANFNRTITASTTLSDLEPGSYTVTPRAVRVDGVQIDSLFDGTSVGSPADVSSGSAVNVAVNYARRSGTGTMWVTNYANRTAFGFGAAQIANTGAYTAPADAVLSLPDAGTGSATSTAIAFSPTGDAWIGYCKLGSKPQVVVKFNASDLAANGAPAGATVLTMPSPDFTYDCVSVLAFDAFGNLWVAMYDGHLLRFSPDALLTTGSPTPDVVLSSPAFREVVDITFDSGGNMFVGAYASPTISRLSPSQLTADDDAIVPAVSLSGFNGVGGFAFDPEGDLWVAEYDANTVREFDVSVLSASGTPTSDVTLTAIAGPEQLAFDEAGNLWVASFKDHKVYGFSAADILTSGTKTPRTSLTSGGGVNRPYGLRFNPQL